MNGASLQGLNQESKEHSSAVQSGRIWRKESTQQFVLARALENNSNIVVPIFYNYLINYVLRNMWDCK